MGAKGKSLIPRKLDNHARRKCRYNGPSFAYSHPDDRDKRAPVDGGGENADRG